MLISNTTIFLKMQENMFGLPVYPTYFTLLHPSYTLDDIMAPFD